MQLELHQIELKYAALRLTDRAGRSTLMARLSSEGQQLPVLVVRGDRPERFVLIDGYQRVAALQALGRDVVEAAQLWMPEDLALAMSHRLQKSREPSALEEGWLLKELVVRHGHSQSSLPTLLGRDKSWVSRRLAMVSALPETVQEGVRSGRVCARAAMRTLVPLARANAEHCTLLVENLPTPAPSARAVQRLYEAWRRGDAEVKARIVAQPGLWLRANDEAEGTTEEESPLLNDLSLLASVAARAARRLDQDAASRLTTTERRRLGRLTREARHAFGGLMARLEERDARSPAAQARENTTDARSRDTHCDPATAA